MVKYFFEGFLLSIAYVAPIGMQNSNVVHTAIKADNLKSYQFAITTFLGGIFLPVSCFLGIGSILSGFPEIRKLILPLGCMAMIYIGMDRVLSVPEAVFTEAVITENIDRPFGKSAAMGFVFTWMNPQTIIDGAFLFGGVRASFSVFSAEFFMVGAVVASLVWFFSLVAISTFFQNKIRANFLKIINHICGSIILGYGLMLAYRLIKI